jgi:biotin transport system substrate-specific component
MNNQNERLKMMLVAAMFAGITAILAQLTIPLPLIPITGQTLAVGITATILGSRYGAIAMALYAAIGAVGLPVFTGANGGLAVIFGPTGGYIIGFIVTAYVTGLILEKTSFSYVMGMVANVVGMVITLVLGAIWLKIAGGLSWTEAIMTGVAPFIVVGLIKALLATLIGVTVRKRLVSAKLLPATTAAAHKEAS